MANHIEEDYDKGSDEIMARSDRKEFVKRARK